MHSKVSDETILMGTYSVFWLVNVKWSPDEMNGVVCSTWSTLLASAQADVAALSELYLLLTRKMQNIILI